MKLYKTKSGNILQYEGSLYQVEEDWDVFVNDDRLYKKALEVVKNTSPAPELEELLENQLLPPIGSQEIWASGVTYYNSKMGREEESKETGGDQFYNRVYTAARPELFFKSTAERAVGHNEKVAIRKDSSWDVPEPELTLMVTSSGKIVGYTIGNDMSSRSIEGENPLYLPQAKTYDFSAAIGPCLWINPNPLSPDMEISLQIERKATVVFSEKISISQMKRDPKELVNYLFEACSFVNGCYLMTGTGIVPSSDFTLKEGDHILITIPPIGTLSNTVKTVSYNKIDNHAHK